MSDSATSEPRHKLRLKMSEGAQRLGCSLRHLYKLDASNNRIFGAARLMVSAAVVARDARRPAQFRG